MTEMPVKVFDRMAHIDIEYPRTSDNINAVSIGLSDVRAADDIVIRYDFDRDGWVVFMDLTRQDVGHMEVIAEQQEVAFIPAWNIEGNTTNE